MPTLTGTLADVTGQPLAVRKVSVRATTGRTGSAGLVTTVPAWLDADGTLTVDLEPGPATLTIVTGTGTYMVDLLVEDDHTTLHAAAAAAHRR